MERSERKEFMDCYNRYKDIYRAAISAAVAWEYIAEHRETGAPLTDGEAEAAAREIELRLALAGGEIYALTILSMAEKRYGGKHEQSDGGAARNGGFSAAHVDKST